jgi:hypothetical protein
MKKILNDSIMSLVSDGLLSMTVMKELIRIREFIDRVSDKKYILDSTISSIEAKFGVTPDIMTWGDYFQCDLAMSSLNMSDDEFIRTVDTVFFDIISSWDIFSSNPDEFKEWVETESRKMLTSGIAPIELTDSEKELVHLKILKDYFEELGLNGNFYESELIWYNNFFNVSATGTETIITH